MTETIPVADTVTALGTALIVSSKAPLLLLADDLTVIGASGSFCSAFGIDPTSVNGTKLAALGDGEWDVPQLNSLLRATFDDAASIDAYEMDLKRKGHEPACLVLNAHKLEYGDAEQPRIVLAVTDITSARLAEKLKDELVQRNQILLQELQHRKQPPDHRQRSHAERAPGAIRRDPDPSSRCPSEGNVDCHASKAAGDEECR